MNTLELTWVAVFLGVFVTPFAVLFREWVRARQAQEQSLRYIANRQTMILESMSRLTNVDTQILLNGWPPEILNQKGQLLFPAHWDRVAVGAGRAATKKGG